MLSCGGCGGGGGGGSEEASDTCTVDRSYLHSSIEKYFSALVVVGSLTRCPPPSLSHTHRTVFPHLRPPYRCHAVCPARHSLPARAVLCRFRLLLPWAEIGADVWLFSAAAVVDRRCSPRLAPRTNAHRGLLSRPLPQERLQHCGTRTLLCVCGSCGRRACPSWQRQRVPLSGPSTARPRMHPLDS